MGWRGGGVTSNDKVTDETPLEKLAEMLILRVGVFPTNIRKNHMYILVIIDRMN